MRADALIAALAPHEPDPSPFFAIVARPAGPLLASLDALRFGGGARALVARAWDDADLAPPIGLEPATFAFVLTGALALGPAPWPAPDDPGPLLHQALRAEPDGLDRLVLGGATRLTRDPALLAAARAWRDALAAQAPALHERARAWTGEAAPLGERVAGFFGRGPDLASGAWARPVVVAVLAGVVAPR